MILVLRPLPPAGMRMAIGAFSSVDLLHQITQTTALISAIEGEDWLSWHHLPAFRMWESDQSALRRHLHMLLQEYAWRNVGEDLTFPSPVNVDEPLWLSDPRLNESHRAYLLRKNYVHYKTIYSATTDISTSLYWPN